MSIQFPLPLYKYVYKVIVQMIICRINKMASTSIGVITKVDYDNVKYDNNL